MGAYGGGGLIGSATLVLLGNIRRKGLVLTGVAFIWGLALVGLGFSREFYLSLGCLIIIGLALSIWLNNLYTLLQTTVEPQMRGRVISLNKVLMQQPMFWLVGGIVASVLGHLGTLLLGGGVLVLLHLIAYWRTPELRQVDRAQ